MKVRTKVIGTVVIGAALVAPVAEAQRPDDRNGARGPGAIAVVEASASQHPDNRAVRGAGPVATREASIAARPDDRSDRRLPGTLGSTDITVAAHPDNRAGARGPGAVTSVVVDAPSSPGFDWGDATIGGLGGIGMALVLMGGLFLAISQRSKLRTA